MGNLKFDIVPPSAQLELGRQLRLQFGKDRRIFLAASTREGEEELLLSALRQTDVADFLAVIVPRHPQRFDEVAELLDRHGFRFERRSYGKPIAADTQIVLGDSMGEMFAYYAACDIAFIGGSLLPFGGQNLIEACAVGKPVLIGPHTFNFAQASEQAVELGAAQRLTSATQLPERLRYLFSHPEEMAEMSAQGIRFVEMHRGATNLALQAIQAYLPSARPG